MAEEIDQAAPAEQAEIPRWLIGAQLITAGLTFVGTFVLAVMGQASAPFAIAGAALLLIFRFGDLSSLSFEAPGGIKGALNAVRRETRKASRVTKEAEETIETLRRTGMLLSAHVLHLMSLQGQGVTATIPELFRARDEVVGLLKDLGCTPEQIDDLTISFRANTFTNMLFMVMEEATGGVTMPLRMHLAELQSDFTLDQVKALFDQQGVLDAQTERRLEEIFRFKDTNQIDFSRFDLK